LKVLFLCTGNSARSILGEYLLRARGPGRFETYSAARESCPVFPGQPTTLHWSLPDPADFQGPEEEHYALFQDVGGDLARRIELFSEKLTRTGL
jgi:arsenate reductase